MHTVKFSYNNIMQYNTIQYETRSSADADNRLDAFSGQSRSTNMVPFHMLHIASYCAIIIIIIIRAFVRRTMSASELNLRRRNSNFVFKTRRFYDIRLQKIS